VNDTPNIYLGPRAVSGVNLGSDLKSKRQTGTIAERKTEMLGRFSESGRRTGLNLGKWFDSI